MQPRCYVFTQILGMHIRETQANAHNYGHIDSKIKYQ